MDVGQRGERVVDAILAARSRAETRNLGPRKRHLPFEAIIAHWLKELGLIESFQVEEIGRNSNLYKVEIIKSRGAPKVLIPDVGFGVSQILPVLVLLYYVPSGSTVLLEQPEIHLHPAVQSGLADIILNVANHRKVQVVVESHSEHLLRRFQRRVAEGNNDIRPDDIALYFCQTRAGQSVITPLELDLYGSILNWPNGFFGDEFGELAAMQEAALRRKLAEKNSAESG
jgi:predicted ATPase